MDTHKECVDFFNSVIRPIDERLTIVEGDLFDVLSSVDTKNAILKFPFLQETFLILYDIGKNEELLNLYFALLMLESDEYALCNELLSKIENQKKPKCSNPKTLNIRIMFEQIFIMLHECGHYFVDTRKETRIFLYNGVLDLEHEYEDNIKKNPYDETEWRESLLREIGNDKSEEFYRNLWNTANYAELSKKYHSRISNLNESSADLYALLTFSQFLKDDSPFKGRTDVVYVIFEAVCFVSFITNLKKQLVLNADNDEESLAKKMADPYSDFYMNLFRFHVLITYIYKLWDAIPIEIYQVYNIINAKTHKTLNKELYKYEKYIDAWAKGNTNSIDINVREKLNERIVRYSESLNNIYVQ